MNRQDIVMIYKFAEDFVIKNGFYYPDVVPIKSILETEWYKTIDINGFLREYIWVVLCSGFKVSVVSQKWSEIEKSMHGFDIWKMREENIDHLLQQCPIKNKLKLHSILKAAYMITHRFIHDMHNSDATHIHNQLLKLPYIGNITVWHLMRNIGIDCYKPDRHIIKLSEIMHIKPDDIFSTIIKSGAAKYIGVADVILWRACASLGGADKFVEQAYTKGLNTYYA